MIFTIFPELIKAIKKKDIDELVEAMDNVKVQGFTSELHQEMSDADRLLQSLLRIQRLKKIVLDMDSR